MRVVQYAHVCARKSLVTPDDQAPHVPHYFVGAAPIHRHDTHVIRPDDLVVGVRDDRFYVRWLVRDADVRICSGHMLAPNCLADPPVSTTCESPVKIAAPLARPKTSCAPPEIRAPRSLPPALTVSLPARRACGWYQSYASSLFGLALDA